MTNLVATRPLGATGLEVSVVGLGAGQIGDPALDERGVEQLLRGALERGVTLIDTARSYGDSEARIARHLAGHRDAYVLSTKVGYGITGEPDWTGPCVARGIDEALARLATDRIDVVFLHSCPREVLERGEVIAALAAARQAGKLRAAGYSGENDALAWAIESGAFDVVQCSVNLADQACLDDALPRAAARRLGVLAKRPLANAAYRYAAPPDAPDHRAYFDRLAALALNPRDLPWPELALRFAAFAPGVSSAIVGTSKLANLEAAVIAASRGPLDADHLAAIRDAFHAHGTSWPGVI